METSWYEYFFKNIFSMLQFRLNESIVVAYVDEVFLK